MDHLNIYTPSRTNAAQQGICSVQWGRELHVQDDYKTLVIFKSLIYLLLEEVWQPTLKRSDPQLKEF